MVSFLFQSLCHLGSEWVLWLLMGLSVMSFGVIFERLFYFRQHQRKSDHFWRSKGSQWLKSGFPEGLGEAGESWDQGFPCPEMQVMRRLWREGHRPREALERILKAELMQLQGEGGKFLTFLGSLGSNAPFLGLFGTVLGMIQAFSQLGQGVLEKEGVSALHLSLSEALVATAAGLWVALPAVLFFNFFSKKWKLLMIRTETLAESWLAQKSLDRREDGTLFSNGG